MPYKKKCYNCGSRKTIKYGHLKYGHSRWLCKKCGRTFSHKLPKTKIPYEFILFSLHYIESDKKKNKSFRLKDTLSDLNKIIRIASFPTKKDKISLSTLYEWKKKYKAPKKLQEQKRAYLFVLLACLEEINLPIVGKLGVELLQKLINKHGYEHTLKIVSESSKEELLKEGMKEEEMKSPNYGRILHQNTHKLINQGKRIFEESDKL